MPQEFIKHRNLPRSIFVPGGRYFITTAARARAPFFGEPVLRFVLLKDLIITLVLKGATLTTLALLPDHIHMIIRISSVNPSEIMRSFKSNSSRNVNRVVRPGDEFRWQRSFYDRLVRDEKEFDRLKRYILMNPKKHGVEAFTWSSGCNPSFTREVIQDIITFSEMRRKGKRVAPANKREISERDKAIFEAKINNHVTNFFGLNELPDLI